MRVVAEIPHSSCKITIFSWNGKYLIKFEQGPLEQTYKIRELDVSGEADIRKLVADEQFIQDAYASFINMGAALTSGMERL